MTKPILALDFDGCIHGYDSGWKGAGVIPDDPVPGAGLYLLQAVQHFRVAIFSSRSRSLIGRWAMNRYVQRLLRETYMAHSAAGDAAWAAVIGKPVDWRPWTAGDVLDAADEIAGKIEWPWFKPPALMTIDDRALTFNGNWSDPAYSPQAIKRFRPWNKKPRVAA